MARFTLDSNVLIYAADNRDAAKHTTALRIIHRAAFMDCVLIPQALAEFFSVTTRKTIVPRAVAAAQMQDWLEIFGVGAGPTGATLLLAAEAATAGRFQFYDSLLLATAGAAGCTAVISKDMHPGAELGQVRVVAAFDAAGAMSAEARALLGL